MADRSKGKRKVKEWLFKHLSPGRLAFAQVVSALIVGISTALCSDEIAKVFVAEGTAAGNWAPFWTALLAAGLVVTTVSALVAGSYGKSVAELEVQAEDALKRLDFVNQQIDMVFKGYLALVARGQLKFAAGGSQERISLYVFDKSGHFVLAARYSENPSWERPGRAKLPADRGIIGKAWQAGWVFDNNFPDPLEDFASYAEYCRQVYTYEWKVVHEMKMKSRLYCAMRVEDQSPLHQKIGVVVIESTDCNRYTETELAAILKEHEGEFISSLMTNFGPSVARPSDSVELERRPTSG